MAYNLPAALGLALGPDVYAALFDDDNDGAANSDAVAQIMLRAHERLKRTLLVAYDGAIPFTEATAPDSVKVMELEYAIVLANSRAPKYSRTKLAEALEALDEEAKANARGFTKTTADQPSPGPYVAVAEDEYAAGIEEASLARRGAGECPPSFWRVERERR